ncbi:hypothetical protein ICW40_01155 [Actinotalea ferrariae]|uniref:hypothetical protein n=1 Tax=Actinotalea ferrariae TaxID=1386098 RepID=UPI001C8C024F|nr:hypothetical protein [Actinotalea ferrariae]MBX9243413.1 hypothetical protein [Actinotalea ferrariae]
MLSVRESRELQAATLALKAADRELRNDINRSTTQTIGPVWKSVVAQHATGQMDARVLAQGARVKAGNPPTAVAATSRRKLRGGLVPVASWHAWEFGADRNAVTTYQRRSKTGGTHKVTRHTRRQLPPRIRTGRVIFPAFADVAPRAVSLWVQLIVRKYADAAEGKG